MLGRIKQISAFSQLYLHVWRGEIDFTEFENEKVMPVCFHWDVVAECGGMITLGLVQDLILLRHTRYDQLLAKVRGCTNLIRILDIPNPKSVNMGVTTTVHSIHDLLSQTLKYMDSEKIQFNLPTTSPGYQKCDVLNV